MKKFLSLFAVILIAITAGATERTVTYQLSVDGRNINKDGVTAATNMPWGDLFDEYNNAIRGGTFSVSSGNFTKIVVTANDVYMINMDEDYNTISGWSVGSRSATWTGSASSVAFGTIMGNEQDVTIVFTIEEPDTGYDLTLSNASTEHGTVAFTVGGETVTKAKKDDVVTVSVTPNEGYTVASVSASYGDEATALEVTANTDGTYSFTMPEGAVTVSVTYGPATYSITLADGTEDKENWIIDPTTASEGQKVTLTYNGTKKVKSVKVVKKAPSTIPVTAITLDKTEATIYKVSDTTTETLTATVEPDEATDKTVTWASSDESVCTVADGIVTAVAEGTATITATANDGSGVTGTCEVIVTDLSAYYSKMVECPTDDMGGGYYDGGNPTDGFTQQTLSASVAIALAKVKAEETGSNCAVYYAMGNSFAQVMVALSDGTTKSVLYYYDDEDKGIVGYRRWYVSK